MRERILRRVAKVSCDHAPKVLGVFGAVTAAAIVVIALCGKVSTDLADVLPKGSEATDLYVEVARRFGADFLFVALESERPEDVQAAKPFADRLASKLRDTERFGKYVRAVEYKELGEKVQGLARELLEERGYLLLGENDRKLLRRKLTTEAIHEQMVENRKKLESAGLDYFKRRIRPDPLDLYEIFERRRSRASRRPEQTVEGRRASGGEPVLAGRGGQFMPKEGEEYLVSPDGTLLLVIIQGTQPAMKDPEFNQQFLAAVGAAEEEVWAELVSEDAPSSAKATEGSGVRTSAGAEGDAEKWATLRERIRIGYGGGYAFAVNETRILRHDLGWCFATSLVAVLAIFVLGFRRLGALFYIGLPLVASISWTLAAAFLLFGHISMMSGGFAAILVGLSVDFAIHIYNGYVSERARGVDVPAAIEGSLVKTGSGIFFGALTSSVAFSGVMLTRFTGLREFGFLAAIGVLLGMTAMFFALPALLYMRSRVGEEPKGVSKIYGFHLDRVARVVVGRPGIVFGVSAALAVAAAAFVYWKMDRYFFDSDLKNLSATSPVAELQERLQRKFGTTISPMVVLSRGATEREALSNGASIAQGAASLREGVRLVQAALPEGDAPAGKPFIRVAGCKARVRRGEIVFPEGVEPPAGRAATAELVTRPDGSRLLVYTFSSDEEMNDWELDGPHSYYKGVAELDAGADRAVTMRWRHEIAAPAEVSFSVRFLGEPTGLELGLGDAVSAAAPFGEAGRAAVEKAFPPSKGDQVRLTLVASGPDGIELFAGRGTVERTDTIAPEAKRLMPPIEEQRENAELFASIDVDRVERDIAAAAKSRRFKPAAFRDFVERLRGIVGRAKDPSYVSLENLSGGDFGPLLAKYYRHDPKEPGDHRHTVATYLYSERGEMPAEWYRRVAASLGDAGELSAGRLVSLEIRDMVHQDFKYLTFLVFLGVAGALLWSFRSPAWAVAALGPVFASFALMLATMLVIKHRMNFLNVLVFPVLVGIGIDYGIHVVHRFRQSVSVREIMTETGRAFVLTTLTTMAGFGSLVMSRYRGLSSFGFVTLLGMVFVLLTSLVALPSFLALIERRRAHKKEGAGT